MDKIGVFRAIIIDDEKKGISALKQLIEKYIPDVAIIATCMKAQEAIPLIEAYKPEIVFLDIDMPVMNGFEMLDKLEWKSFNLVFTTAHQEYGLRALKNNAVDYLLKPISHKDLSETVRRIKQKIGENTVTIQFNYSELLQSISNSTKPRILIYSLTGVEYIDLEEIICLESKSNYTKLRLANSQEILTRKTLKEFENQLCVPGTDFMRVHNSFIINLRKVIKYLKTKEEIILVEEITIPLSKARREQFFKWLNI